MNDSSYRDADAIYSWYDSIHPQPGVMDNGVCTSIRCDTESYVEEFNDDLVCGKSNWRLPNIMELVSLADISYQEGFNLYLREGNESDNRTYWTSTDFSQNYGNDYAMIVGSTSRLVDRDLKQTPNSIRLVTRWLDK